MKTAKPIADFLASTGREPSPDAIRCVVLDGLRAVCHTEATLDTWWANLSPDQKAAIYERDMDEPHLVSGICRYCGCTDNRACNPLCAWITPDHTVCSADPCVEQYESDRDGEVRDLAPGAASSVPAAGLQLVPRMSPELLTRATELLAGHQRALHAPLVIPARTSSIKEAHDAAL